jgi:hypothetical protein
MTATGPVTLAITSKTSAYTLVTATDDVCLVDPGSGSVTITLPTSSSGKIFLVKNTNMGSVVVTTTSSQLIDGDGQLNIPGHGLAELIGDGSNWFVINRQ